MGRLDAFTDQQLGLLFEGLTHVITNYSGMMFDAPVDMPGREEFDDDLAVADLLQREIDVECERRSQQTVTGSDTVE